MYIQLDFIVRRLSEKAGADPSLADQQPYQAARSGDLNWFGDAITKHYQGDDTDLKVLAGSGAVAARVDDRRRPRRAGQHVLRRGQASRRWAGPTPTCSVSRRWWSCCATWRPTGSPATSSPAAAAISCGPITSAIYGIPPERVVGSSQGLKFDGADGHGDLLIQPALDVFDDGPRNRCGSGTASAGARSSRRATPTATIEMLMYSGTGRGSLRLLVLHDDAEREFDYTAGARSALDHAAAVRLDRRQHARTTGRPSSVTDWICVLDSGADRATVGSDQHYPEEAPARAVTVDGSGSSPIR